MLADTVESAVRALPEPNANRIELTVHTLLMKRLMDGLEIKGVMPRIQAEDEAEADALLREAERIVGE